MIEAGVGEGVVEGACVSGFGIRGRVDQTRETARVGGAGAHGARFQGGVEGAACQSPSACSGGCTTDGEELGVGGGITCSLTLICGDGQNLLSPGDDSSDRNLALVCSVLSGEQGAAHHGEVGLRRVVCQWRRHKSDDSSLSFADVAPDEAGLGSLPLFRQFAFDTGSDLIPYVSKRPKALFVATGGLRRSRERPAQAVSCSREDRTGLVRRSRAPYQNPEHTSISL
jgi:hypothetical protein